MGFAWRKVHGTRVVVMDEVTVDLRTVRAVHEDPVGVVIHRVPRDPHFWSSAMADDVLHDDAARFRSISHRQIGCTEHPADRVRPTNVQPVNRDVNPTAYRHANIESY